MKDLTQGSIRRHIVEMAVPIAAGMLFQTLYLMVDLYFVAQLGDAAIAGVGSAGTFGFAVLALTQMLGVGTVTLMSHAVGRKDQAEANLVFNQSLVLAAACALVTLFGGYALAGLYMRSVSADVPTMAAGLSYLRWYMPGLALQFAIVTMGSALRGTGIVKPGMIVQALTVVLNTILAPILIAGWGTGYPMGVAGAGLASSLSIMVGVVLLALYFARLERYVALDPAQFRPRFVVWKRMLNVGLPAGGEFVFMFINMSVIYWVISDFGAAAQAGFGIGSRINQAIFLPAMAVAFATAPVAGQNFGARLPDRVRETFRAAVMIGSGMMLALTLVCQWLPGILIRGFTHDAAVIAVGAEFLRVISWNFVATGLIFTCSGMFQGLGNTWPALLSTLSRLLFFVPPLIWLSAQPQFELHHVWYVSIAASLLQAVVSYMLLQGQFRTRLRPAV